MMESLNIRDHDMKIRILSFALASCAVLFMSGADFISPDNSSLRTAPYCSGYVVIEAGKGLDCNGDTILLVNRKGFYERIYFEERSIDDGVAAN